MDNLHERRALPDGWEWKRQLVDARLLDMTFTNFDINAHMFTEKQIECFINICETLEKEI